jgi:hypothetical protein
MAPASRGHGIATTAMTQRAIQEPRPRAGLVTVAVLLLSPGRALAQGSGDFLMPGELYGPPRPAPPPPAPLEARTVEPPTAPFGSPGEVVFSVVCLGAGHERRKRAIRRSK